MPRKMPRRTSMLFALALAAGLLAPQAQAQGNAGAYLSARVAAAESDYRAAAAGFARALLSDPANPALLEGLVIAKIGMGDMDAAADVARLLLATGTESQSGYIALMTAKAQAGDFAGMLQTADAGQSVGALFDGLLRAWAELGTGRMSEALAGFDALSQTPGLEAFGLYHKALALASVGDFEGADEILSGRAAGPIQVMRRGVIAQAQILSQLERNPDALALLDRSFGPGQDPGIDDLRRRLTAGEPLPFEVARNPTDGIAEVFFTLATALSGEADDGYTLLFTRAAMHLRPDHVDAIMLTAGLLEGQKQYELATEAYAMILPENPAYNAAEIGRAEATRSAGRKEASIEILQALTRSHGQLVAVHQALGDALRRDERYAEAIRSYDMALSLSGEPSREQWPLFYSRGIGFERTGDWPRAEADFRMALQLEPDQPQVLNYLGYSFVDRGENLDEALAMIERAVAARPDQGYILDSLAWALYRMGRVDEALMPMERASLLEPLDPIVTDHLGDVYWAVGRVLEARFQWRRALSFNPAEADATRIRRKLEIGLDAVLAEESAAKKPAETAGSDGN